MKLKESVQHLLTNSLNDPITKLLASNSHLTKTQLETLLIDILADNIADKKLKYDEKAKLRLTKAKISRGSFNRTLKQAKENVLKAIYTVLLLGYLGIIESTTLDPYVEIANKLQEYIEACKSPQSQIEHAKIIENLKEELEKSLRQLAEGTEDDV